MRMPRVFVGMLLLSAMPALADTAQDAQVAWENRDKPGERERAITLLQQTLKANPQRTDLLPLLARAIGSAFRNTNDARERKRWSELGVQVAQEAVAKNPTSAEAHARYGEALGQWAQSHKGLKGLRRVKEAVASLEKAIALEPSNWFAHSLLAEFYRQAPSGISVGDKQKALTHARKAVEAGPSFALPHLTLAKALLEQGKKPEAEAELRRVTHLAAPIGWGPETRADQDSAQQLLREIGASGPHSAGQACHDSSECRGACLGELSAAPGTQTSGTCSDAPASTGDCSNEIQAGKATGNSCH